MSGEQVRRSADDKMRNRTPATIVGKIRELNVVGVLEVTGRRTDRSTVLIVIGEIGIKVLLERKRH